MFIFYLSGNKGEEVIQIPFTPHFSLRISVQTNKQSFLHFVFIHVINRKFVLYFIKPNKLNP